MNLHGENTTQKSKDKSYLEGGTCNTLPRLSSFQAKELLGENFSRLPEAQIETLVKQLSQLANSYIGDYLNSVSDNDDTTIREKRE